MSEHIKELKEEINVLADFFGVPQKELEEIYDDTGLLQARQSYVDQQPVVDALSYLKPEETREYTEKERIRSLRRRFNDPKPRT